MERRQKQKTWGLRLFLVANKGQIISKRSSDIIREENYDQMFLKQD